MPTAELLLTGARGRLVSEPGRGVAAIAAMINVTRVYNSFSAVSFMRRALALARDYSAKRRVFGKPLSQQPLHQRTLAALEVGVRGCLLLSLETARLMGRAEIGGSKGMGLEEEGLLLRLLIPLTKLFTAKAAVASVSEGLECFGGQGYIEDTHIPVLLRDTQVLPIWEGTTNVLSLDVLRVIQKSKGRALVVFCSSLSSIVANCIASLHSSSHPVPDATKTMAKFVADQLNSLVAFVRATKVVEERDARAFSFSLASAYTSALLLAVACLGTGAGVAGAWTASSRQGRVSAVGVEVAYRWLLQYPLEILRETPPFAFDSELALPSKY
eukprot:GILI01024742.1.p1 GENE.GILI01024742.1~~GILI01024742.1.p1  ORF type:complete len:328 (+),score=57.34 GILI01024742.1:35-1018(+)